MSKNNKQKDYTSNFNAVRISSIIKAIQHLEGREKRVTLMLAEGKEYEEIAKSLNISEGNARVIFTRAKKNIEQIAL